MNQNNLHFQVPPSLMASTGVSAQQQSLASGFPVINGNPTNCSTATSMNNVAQMANISALLNLDQNSLLAMLGIDAPVSTAAQHAQTSHVGNQGASHAIRISNQPAAPIRMPPHTAHNQNPQMPQIHPSTGLLPSSLSTVYGPAHLFNPVHHPARPPVTQPPTQPQPSTFSQNSQQQLQGYKPPAMAMLPQVQHQFAVQQPAQQWLPRTMLAQQPNVSTAAPQNPTVSISNLAQNQASNDLYLYYAVQEMMEKQKQQQEQQQRQQLEVFQRIAAQEAAVLQAQAQVKAQAQSVSKPSVMGIAQTTTEALIALTRGSPQTIPSIPTTVQAYSQQPNDIVNPRKRIYEIVEKQHDLASSPSKIPKLNMVSPNLATVPTTFPIREKRVLSQEEDEVIIVDDIEAMPKLTPETDVKEKPDEESTCPLNDQIQTHMLRIEAMERDKCKTSENGIQPDLGLLFATIPGHIVYKMLDDILNTTLV
uniref:Uncharacterized protein n=1 Tax=Acrobeloides nanus TaxID=290746 RepID=A0A914DNF7_9BILA